MTAAWHDWQHEILPPLAQQILRDAVKVGLPDSSERQRAVEHAIYRVHCSFPQFFKPNFETAK